MAPSTVSKHPFYDIYMSFGGHTSTAENALTFRGVFLYGYSYFM